MVSESWSSVQARVTDFLVFVFFNDPATTEIYTLSLHDALPICRSLAQIEPRQPLRRDEITMPIVEHAQLLQRSEEHTSELQSLTNLVCRLLLEKKKPRLRITAVSSLLTRYSKWTRTN